MMSGPSRLSACSEFYSEDKNKIDVISTNELNGLNKKKVLRHGPASENMYRMCFYMAIGSPSATIVRKSLEK